MEGPPKRAPKESWSVASILRPVIEPLARRFPRTWGSLVRNRVLIYTVILIGLAGVIMNVLFGGNLVQTLVTGLVVGSIYVLGATGLSLLYGVKKFANFAHGDLMTLGAYMAFFVNVGAVQGLTSVDFVLLVIATTALAGIVAALLAFHLLKAFRGRIATVMTTIQPILLIAALLLIVVIAKAVFGPGHVAVGLVYAIVILALVGIVLETLVFRKLEGKGLVAPLIASVGVAIVIQNLINAGFGTDIQTLLFPRPGNIVTPWFQINPVKGVLTLGASIVAVLLLHLMLSRTTLGKSMRATSDNVDLARSSGINTSNVTLWTWVISCMLAGLGGVLLAMSVDVRPLLGFQVLLFLFAAVIIGGIGSPYGAMIGGFAVGVIQELSGLLFDWLGRPDVIGLEASAAWRPMAAFAVMVIVLLVRPEGLMGAATRRAGRGATLRARLLRRS